MAEHRAARVPCAAQRDMVFYQPQIERQPRVWTEAERKGQRAQWLIG